MNLALWIPDRIYDNLPEVKKKQEEKQKRIILQSNRLRVEMFKKVRIPSYFWSKFQWIWSLGCQPYLTSCIPPDFYHLVDFISILKHFCIFFFLAITGPAPSQKHGVTKEPLAHHPNRILNAFDCLISHKINCYLNYLEVFFLSLALCIKKDHLCFNRNFKAIFK